MYLTYVVWVSLAELSVGLTTEGIDVHSVGNTLVLHQSALIEAFNLKAAIEYQLKNRKKKRRERTEGDMIETLSFLP